MGEPASWRGVPVYTVGHSTRSVDELIGLLRSVGIAVLVDVRTIPRSRHNPQFNRDQLRSSLRSQRIRYVHLPELGGLRRPRKDSPNPAWRNAGFRGFADHMLTPEFEQGLQKLRALTAEGPIAVMCAEAVPWRCHRSLIADTLSARGARVEHITGTGHSAPHRMTPFARIEGTRLTYPAAGLENGHLATRGPFHLEATVRVLQRRPTSRVDVWEQRYLRVLETSGSLVLVEVTNHGTIDHPDVRFRVLQGDDPPSTRAVLAETLRTILGLEVDPRPLQRLLETERRLGAIARGLRGMRPPRFPTLFEAFANVIPFQQVSLESGIAIVGRLVERLGESLVQDGQRRHAFPATSAVAEARLDRLRACGLSARKAEALRRIATAIESGDLTETRLSTLSSDEAIRFLTELPGIGTWSASVVLLRGLGRLGVFPPGDVGATRGLRALMHLRAGSSLDRVIERFGDHGGYLYFCALGGRLLERGLIHPAVQPVSGSRTTVAASTSSTELSR